MSHPFLLGISESLVLLRGNGELPWGIVLDPGTAEHRTDGGIGIRFQWVFGPPNVPRHGVLLTAADAVQRLADLDGDARWNKIHQALSRKYALAEVAYFDDGHLELEGSDVA
jgi:hypothetical protein